MLATANFMQPCIADGHCVFLEQGLLCGALFCLWGCTVQLSYMQLMLIQTHRLALCVAAFFKSAIWMRFSDMCHDTLNACDDLQAVYQRTTVS